MDSQILIRLSADGKLAMQVGGPASKDKIKLLGMLQTAIQLAGQQQEQSAIVAAPSGLKL